MTVRRNAQGFILVAVRWIVSALAAMASIYAVFVANTAVAVAVNDDALEVEALVAAAVELTAFRLLEESEESRPTRGAFSFRLGHATVVVEFCSEAARIDLNEAPREVLAGLFQVVGAAPPDAAQYAERIIGWRTPPRASAQDAEALLYQTAGLSYGPRGARFEHAGELALLLGMPPAMVERILPFVTVFSGSEQVDLLKAAPEIVAALSVMKQDRPTDSPGSGTQVTRPMGAPSVPSPASGGGEGGGGTGAARPPATPQQNAAMRILTGMNFENGRRRAAEVVIMLSSATDTPYRILSWHDDLAVPAAVR